MGKAISKRHIQVSGGRATGTDGKKDKPTTTPTAGSLISIPQIEVSVQKESQSTDTCDDVAAGLTSYATDNSDNPQRKKVAKDTVNDLTGLTYRQCKAVQKSWKALTASNPNQLGVQFFMRFFLNYPDYRNFYSNFRSDSDTSNKEVNRRELRVLRDTATMHDLAAAYMESLTTIFNMLDNQDEVMVILDSLTDRHLPRGVLSLHFQDMMSTLLTFMEEKVGHSNMNTVTRDAWTCALRTIITIIDQRYLELQHKKYIRKP
ncbi:hemoglobin-3-like isoform X2 [Littorina saxatilis]|uniref:hemoglobin-3-like isoform X2 n=1 Tax=Littorina saxatilis TaxID=31220 RepID=UPI0038B5AC69